jgi:hypothetical protein
MQHLFTILTNAVEGTTLKARFICPGSYITSTTIAGLLTTGSTVSAVAESETRHYIENFQPKKAFSGNHKYLHTIS